MRDGGKLYLGGDFTVLSPRSGTMVGFSSDLAHRLEWPEREDPVQAATADGAGGFFVSFNTETGARAHSTLLHLGRAGALDSSFRVEVDGTAATLIRSGGRLYLAGGFDQVAGKPRRNAAAVSTRHGSILPWNPRPNGYVNAIAVTKHAVFLGVSSAAWRELSASVSQLSIPHAGELSPGAPT